jgi:MraZ protein
MFSGRYFHSIDAKGRVAVPRAFRNALGGDNESRVIVTLSPDIDSSYLDIYPADKWEPIVADIMETGFEGLDAADAADSREAFMHHYVHAAQEQQLDGQGRILVPQEHRTTAGLEKEVVFTGDWKKFRLWSRREWERAEARAVANKGKIKAGARKWL